MHQTLDGTVSLGDTAAMNHIVLQTQKATSSQKVKARRIIPHHSWPAHVNQKITHQDIVLSSSANKKHFVLSADASEVN